MNATVVTVGDTINDVLIAAGQVGKGRVVVTTHYRYGLKFINNKQDDPSIKNLRVNIKSWLVKKEQIQPLNIMEASKYLKTSDPNNVKILYFEEPVREWKDQERDKILSFVKKGGGLFVATNPWLWTSQKKSKNFNLMLTYKTLLEAGIALTDIYIYNSKTFYFNKKDTYLSHLGIQVDIMLKDQKQIINYTNTLKVLEQTRFLNPKTLADFRKRIDHYLDFSYINNNAPSLQTPITQPKTKAKLLFYQRFYLNGDYQNEAPKHILFPRTVDQKASNFQYVSREFKFTAPKFREFHHTGLYAVPGKAVTIEVLGDLPNPTWTVSIGFHYDNNVDHPSWVRWPTVYTRRQLTQTTTTFSCGFGGLIVLESFGESKYLKIRVTSAVEAPWYDSKNATSVMDWPNRKKAVGAWGCAVGEWVGFCMQRSSFADVDPSNILRIYDEIYKKYHQLRGTDPKSQRKQYIIADIKPSAGYMHSGYPIVTHLDVATPGNSYFFFNQTALNTLGNWGIFHELGHNMQRSCWTPPGTGEVTVNIFSLKAMQMTTGKKPKQTPFIKDQNKDALKYLNKPDYKQLKTKAGIYLLIYAQFIQDHKWEHIGNVLKSYETGVCPNTQQEQIDQFWSRCSQEIQEDMSGLLKIWGIPLSDKAKQRMQQFQNKYAQKVNLFKD